MLIIALVFTIIVCLAFLDSSSNRRRNARTREVSLYIGIFFGLAAVLVVIIIGINVIRVQSMPSVYRRIELYEAENEKHEKLIGEVVEKYLAREANEKYADLRGEDPMIAVTMINELDVDSYTSWALRAYENNQNKILECRERIIELERIKKVYFFGL